MGTPPSPQCGQSRLTQTSSRCRSDLDTLRAPNRCPTPILKSNDFLLQSDDIWGALGPPFRPSLGVPGVRAGLTSTYLLVR